MIGYRYDNNGYLIGQVEVQESPLEPGVFLMPPNTSITAPPSPPANTIPKWYGEGWVLVSNYSGIPYYKKSDKSVKYFEIGENFDSNYTEVPPLENELFQKWDEPSVSWIVDEEAKTNQENLFRKSTIQRLLLESDYIELPSFLERKGKEIYNTWMTYRANLRSAYHDSELPLPEKPE